MLKLPTDLRLVEEALDQVRVGGVLATEDLQRHVAAQIDVTTAEDLADAALGERADDVIAAAPAKRRSRLARLTVGGGGGEPNLRRLVPRRLHEIEDAGVVVGHGYFPSSAASGTASMAAHTSRHRFSSSRGSVSLSADSRS